MISAVSISTGGVAAAVQRYGRAAEGVAMLGTSLPSPVQMDLSVTAVQLIESKADVSMNVALLRSTLDTEKRVLDILV